MQVCNTLCEPGPERTWVILNHCQASHKPHGDDDDTDDDDYINDDDTDDGDCNEDGEGVDNEDGAS